MKKLVVGLTVLGCYGLMVGAASAGERWSEETCKHLQEMKASTYARGITGAQKRFWSVAAILIAQRDNCGVSTQAELDAALAAVRHEQVAMRPTMPMGLEEDIQPVRRSAPAPRAPVLCDTTPKAYGGSTTDCF